MPGLAIFIMAIFVAALTGMFKRVKNQKTITGRVISLEYKYDSDEKNLPTMLMRSMKLMGKSTP